MLKKSVVLYDLIQSLKNLSSLKVNKILINFCDFKFRIEFSYSYVFYDIELLQKN